MDKPLITDEFGPVDQSTMEFIAVPGVHINMRIGTDLWKEGRAICLAIDRDIANKVCKNMKMVGVVLTYKHKQW